MQRHRNSILLPAEEAVVISLHLRLVFICGQDSSQFLVKADLKRYTWTARALVSPCWRCTSDYFCEDGSTWGKVDVVDFETAAEFPRAG